jgi:Tyrosyl-DNA phosphodiesterase
MSSSEFNWESLLCTDAAGRSLRTGLFTTYDRADGRLLAEHLLPVLLHLGREPQGEGTERQYFLVELHERLKQLHDKLVIVSSAAREEPEDPQNPEAEESRAYPWIWRSIRSLTVGSRRKAVQHAKLWLLHWGANDEGIEHLEIVVSSANLTHAAFKGQLQAAWRACIELRPQGSQVRLQGWGVLPTFLRKLAESAGDDERLEPFVQLLARAECPEGVTFVASVPGTYSRRELKGTPWGAAGLGEIAPPGRGTVSISILSPFVGSWAPDALDRWCAWFGGLSKSLKLVWIDKRHPWAGRWILPKSTLAVLLGAGAKLIRLRHDPDQDRANDPFHEEHRSRDDRWSHAKVYSLKRGNSRRLLVTSANFSPAAWGREGRNGGLTIENFELGVCVEQGSRPFEDLEVFDDMKSAATVSDLPNRATAPIAWAAAAWDGKKVTVKCRCESNDNLKGKIDQRVPVEAWASEIGSPLRSACVPWAYIEPQPSLVRLTCDRQTMTVVVFDERPPLQRQDTLPPEVDKDLGQIMRDELLFEQYGGQIAEDLVNEDTWGAGPDDAEPEADATADGVEKPTTGHVDSYDVPAFVAARKHLAVVDNWAYQVNREAKRSTGTFELQMLRRDGEFLKEAFHRQETRDEKQSSSQALGARLAAEEMTLRLEHFPEN